MHKYKAGKLHSGSKSGPEVKSRKQAVAIMLSEKRAAEGGKKEYMPAKKNRSVMGRKVIHHSPDKFPVSTDPGYDQMLLNADQGKTSGTYGGLRKDMKPMQQESPKPAKALDSMLDYLGKMGGKKK
jgi:hypothetical protein